MISKRVFRSTSVSNTGSSLDLAPIKVSISQCPKCLRESTSSGRSSIEGPSTRRFSRCVGESVRCFRDTFSSKSMFFVFIIPRLIHLYIVYVKGIKFLEKIFSFFARSTTTSGHQPSSNIISSDKVINESQINHIGQRQEL